MKQPPNTRLGALAAAMLLLAAASSPAHARHLDVELWTDRGEDAVYREGDAMRIKVRTTDDSYLLVYEIATNGDVNLLYPWKRGSGRIEGRNTLRIPDDVSDYQLVVERETGQGFIVAVASDQPFRELPWFLRPFDPQAASVGYEDEGDSGESIRDEEGFDRDGRVVGDPYVAMERIRRRVLQDPGDLGSFASAYSTYYVHEQVRYPRYVCNDCHRPNNWAWWPGFDPYYTRCSVVDFRVNWGWCWGPQIWTAYVPYYYYVIRTDCPPRYTNWLGNRNRFSSWDGRRRWSDIWGGELRRYKPGPAPVTYTPPPAPGTKWKVGGTPPGFVPPDVRRQSSSPGTRPIGWLQRDRGDGRPVWRDPKPESPGGQAEGNRLRPDWGRRRPDGSATPAPQGGETGTRERSWRGWNRPDGGDAPAPQAEPRERGERLRPPREESRPDQPRYEPPPRQDPPRGEQSRGDPGYRQPPSQPAQPAPTPRFSPPQGKPDAARGGGRKG